MVLCVMMDDPGRRRGQSQVSTAVAMQESHLSISDTPLVSFQGSYSLSTGSPLLCLLCHLIWVPLGQCSIYTLYGKAALQFRLHRHKHAPLPFHVG